MKTDAGSRIPDDARPEQDPVNEHAGRDSGLPRGYLRACLLLLVAEEPVHGYELLGQLRDFGLAKPDAGAVYRVLRGLDAEGLVCSWWSSSAAGPARRLYQTTAAGRRCLGCLAVALEQNCDHLSSFLDRQRSLQAGDEVPAMAPSGRAGKVAVGTGGSR